MFARSCATSHLDDGFANVVSLEEGDKRLGHPVKTISDGLAIRQLAL